MAMIEPARDQVYEYQDPFRIYKQGIEHYPRGLNRQQEQFLFGCRDMGLPIDYLQDSYFMDSVQEDQRELFGAALADSRTIEDFIVLCNLGLSVSYASKFFRIDKLDHFPDLVQAGNEGLVRAVRKYDPAHESGAKFSTYATQVIRDEVLTYINENRHPISVPEKLQTVMSQANRIRTKFLNEQGRLPSREEAQIELLSLGFSNPRILAALDSISMGLDKAPTSLDVLDAELDEDDELRSIFVDQDVSVEEEALDNVYAQQLASLAKTALPPKGYQVLLLTTGLMDGKVLNTAEAAELVGTSSSGIRMHLRSIREKLSRRLFFDRELS